jgi:halimadienyl-diphosphate synthase
MNKESPENPFNARIHSLLASMSRGTIRPTAYDTAWVARLLEMDRPLGSQAMYWLCENQLKDGSWGAAAPVYYQDRVISTLAAMTALCRFGKRANDRRQIERGQAALDALVSEATNGLKATPHIDSVGFELIAPTLMAEAESLGLIQQHKQQILESLAAHREEKLRLLAGRLIDHNVSTAYSAEMAGTDHMDLLDADHLPEANGSIGCSPSATAYFALTIRPHDPRAIAYLYSLMEEGGVPHVVPYDILEKLWVLWNIAIAYSPQYLPREWYAQHLDSLERIWREKSGLGFASEYSLTDPDDTAMGVDVFFRFGRGANISDLLAYQTDTYYRAYQYESGSSTSINIHVLGALRQAGYPPDHPAVRGVLEFLSQELIENAYWLDKWHFSPYYPTSHAIINCAGWMPQYVEPSVAWILNTQRPNGSWGVQMSSAEETAYALQALCVWRQHGGIVDTEVLTRGVTWMKAHAERPYPPLWIAKCLYCPENIVISAILSAEILVSDPIIHQNQKSELLLLE